MLWKEIDLKLKNGAWTLFFLVLVSPAWGQDKLPEGKSWVPLFNGTDLTGWVEAGKEEWYVEGNELVGESGPRQEYGYLCTDKSYTNFELYLEFKQEQEGNSGVFFRSVLDGTRISGWQVEIAPPGNDTGGIYESYGRGWLAQIPDELEGTLKEGEWNQLRIRVKNDMVMTWLNGTPMARLKDDKIGTGRGVIALQLHEGGGIRMKFRNILIKNLD